MTKKAHKTLQQLRSSTKRSVTNRYELIDEYFYSIFAAAYSFFDVPFGGLRYTSVVRASCFVVIRRKFHVQRILRFRAASQISELPISHGNCSSLANDHYGLTPNALVIRHGAAVDRESVLRFRRWSRTDRLDTLTLLREQFLKILLYNDRI